MELFAIAEFVKEDTVAVVPTIWLRELPCASMFDTFNDLIAQSSDDPVDITQTEIDTYIVTPHDEKYHFDKISKSMINNKTIVLEFNSKKQNNSIKLLKNDKTTPDTRMVMIDGQDSYQTEIAINTTQMRGVRKSILKHISNKAFDLYQHHEQVLQRYFPHDLDDLGLSPAIEKNTCESVDTDMVNENNGLDENTRGFENNDQLSNGSSFSDTTAQSHQTEDFNLSSKNDDHVTTHNDWDTPVESLGFHNDEEFNNMPLVSRDQFDNVGTGPPIIYEEEEYPEVDPDTSEEYYDRNNQDPFALVQTIPDQKAIELSEPTDDTIVTNSELEEKEMAKIVPEINESSMGSVEVSTVSIAPAEISVNSRTTIEIDNAPNDEANNQNHDTLDSDKNLEGLFAPTVVPAKPEMYNPTMFNHYLNINGKLCVRTGAYPIIENIETLDEDEMLEKLKKAMDIKKLYSFMCGFVESDCPNPIAFIPPYELRKSCMEQQNIGASHMRSVILQFLEMDVPSPQDFLQDIEDNGFGPEDNVVGVFPKERELKIFCRLFGLLTIKKRLYVVLTEALIAENLFKYFPEITMTYDSVTLNTKIHANTRQQGGKGSAGYHTVIVNTDFAKWNSNMRKEETDTIFCDIDNLFGLSKVISRTHEMFENATLYLADDTITPINREGEWINSEAVWRGHLGGIEGLRQKGWTIVTVVLLKYIAELNNIRCQIMGQGDNQVLVLSYPIDHPVSLRQRHSTFLKHLDLYLSYFGPPLKLEETWSSSNFFAYGKVAIFEGVPLSMSLKKICRSNRLTNEGIQSLGATLSSIAANSAAATSSDLDPVIPFIIGRLETIGAFHLHITNPFYSRYPLFYHQGTSNIRIPENGVSKTVTPRISTYDAHVINSVGVTHLALLSLLPSILGGYPTLQLHDLLNHGHPDLLNQDITSAIWGLKTLYHYLPVTLDYFKNAIANMLRPTFNDSANYEMLCEDPLSINLLSPSTGSEKLKRMSFNNLCNCPNVVNQTFVTFLNLAQKQQKPLSDILCTMKPCNPRYESNFYVSVLNHIYGEPNTSITLDPIITCSTTYAQRLRNQSWGIPITGVTVAVPQEAFTWHTSKGEGCEVEGHPVNEAGHILIRSDLRSSVTLQHNFDPSVLPLGPFKPFFGSKPRQKFSMKEGSSERLLLHFYRPYSCV
ncbi:hypothetical protein WDU94_010807 [Cyamophila willieti]